MMEFRDYQQRAQETDQNPDIEGDGLVVPLLGMAGEVGTLLADYKKKLRDRDTYRMFKESIAEELGDILWYVANLATKLDLDLEEIAAFNLRKTRERWLRAEDGQGRLPFYLLLDERFPPEEQLPRTFSVKFTQEKQGTRASVVLTWNGRTIGNRLTDNAYVDDGYRFHDVFHLSYAAVLGWSPVTRKLMQRKRRSNPQVDEVEDGGRASVTEEGISAYVFSYAKDHGFLENVRALDYELLRTIRRLAASFEVNIRSPAEWERAILAGYQVWRQMREREGGVVKLNLLDRTISYSPE